MGVSIERERLQLLLFADTIGQHLIKPNGIPAGIVVSMIGAPYFIYLLMKK